MHNSLSLKLKALSAAAMLMAAGTGYAYQNSVTYSKGQGLIADGFGGYDLITERCGIANGADAEGPYILWVLTATGANNADIKGPWSTVEQPVSQMTKFGSGTFKYISSWQDPSTLPGNVVATYDGKAKKVQLTISHGCRPKGTGWCSPGFWKNAKDGAWALVLPTTKLSTFNSTVVPTYYDTANSDTLLTLWSVLTYTGPGGANKYGASSAPYGLNAYNATGAFLTGQIPGVTFSEEKMRAGGSDACPIDHFGNFKE